VGGGTPGPAPRLTFALLVCTNQTPLRGGISCAAQVPTHQGRPPAEVEERTFARFGRAEVRLLRRREGHADKGNLVVRGAGTKELLKPGVEDDDRAPTAYVMTL
jgi:hypothetical protein